MRLIGEMPESYQRYGNDAESAAHELMRCLGRERGVTYDLAAQPDQDIRNHPAPDFRFKEIKTERIALVEYFRWVSPSEREAATLIQKGKLPQPRTHERLAREGVEQLSTEVWNGRPAALLSMRTLDESLLSVIKEQILTKLNKDQLNHEAAERILLVDVDHEAVASFFADNEINVTLEERGVVDAAYLIADRKSIFQIW